MSGAVPPPAARPLERAARVPVCVCVRVRALLGRVGRAGLPGAFWCASPFPLAALSFCFAWPPPGCSCLSSLPWRFFFFFFFFFFPFFFFFFSLPLPLFVAPPWCLGVVFFFFFFFFFSSRSSFSVRPLCPRLSLVSGPGCLGPRRLRCLLCWPAASGLSVRLFLFRAFRLAVGCSLVVAAPPPPLLFLAVSVAAARCCVPCCAVRGWVLRCAALLRVVSPGVVLSCAVLRSFGAAACCAVPSGAARRPGALCSAALCFAVFPRAVCSVLCVFCRGAVVVLCVSRGAVLCVPCALRSARCCASLCWCARVVLFVWCVPLLAPGAVVRCCVLCCFLWCAVVRCWVCWPVVVCWWRVSVSVSLSGRVVCFPVVGVVCCGALLSCVVFCGAVLSRGAVLLLSAVVLRCCWGLLCPSVGCRAVLCCAVGWLCCFLPGGGVCALWCSFPRALVPCCRVVPWCPVLSPCWVCFLRGCGCTYLKNRC